MATLRYPNLENKQKLRTLRVDIIRIQKMNSRIQAVCKIYH